jgi:hypothetical protein
MDRMDDRHEANPPEKIVIKSALATLGTPEYLTRFDQARATHGDDGR